MTNYITKHWKIEISPENSDRKLKGHVVRVLVQKKQTLESIQITLPVKDTKNTIGIFHNWLRLTEGPISIMDKLDQLTVFERVLKDINNTMVKNNG